MVLIYKLLELQKWCWRTEALFMNLVSSVAYNGKKSEQYSFISYSYVIHHSVYLYFTVPSTVPDWSETDDSYDQKTYKFIWDHEIWLIVRRTNNYFTTMDKSQCALLCSIHIVTIYLVPAVITPLHSKLNNNKEMDYILYLMPIQ